MSRIIPAAVADRQALFSIKWLGQIYKGGEYGKEYYGAEYKDYAHDSPNILAVTVAHASTQPRVGNGSHTRPKKDRIKQCHGLIVA